MKITDEQLFKWKLACEKEIEEPRPDEALLVTRELWISQHEIILNLVKEVRRLRAGTYCERIKDD